MTRFAVWIGGALAAALGLVATVIFLERAPGGPVEPAWDRQVCAHCRMHLSERGFAAQLHTTEGEILFFDEPGCLFLWQAESAARPEAIYYHHLREERWLAESEAGFVHTSPTPMGWGFGAVERETPGAVDPAAARAEVAALAGGGGTGGRDGRPAH